MKVGQNPPILYPLVGVGIQWIHWIPRGTAAMFIVGDSCDDEGVEVMSIKYTYILVVYLAGLATSITHIDTLFNDFIIMDAK